jgi:MFS family permease
VTGIAGLGIAFTDSFEQLLALRVLQGIGYSGVQPITVTLLGDLYEGPKETTAQGIRTFINSIGGSVFPLVGGALLVVSWKAPFFLYVFHLLAAVLAFYTIPTITGGSSDTGARRYVGLIASMLSRTRIRVLFLATFTIYFLRYGIVTYLPLLLVREFGVATSDTGLFVGLATACGGIGGSQAGRISRRLTRKRTLQAGLLVAGVLLIALPFTRGTSPAVAAGVIVCYGVTWGITGPVQKSLLNQLVTARVRAGTIAASYMATNLGKSAAPIGIGVAIAATNYRAGFALLGLLPIVTTLAFVGFREPGDAPD